MGHVLLEFCDKGVLFYEPDPDTMVHHASTDSLAVLALGRLHATYFENFPGAMVRQGIAFDDLTPALSDDEWTARVLGAAALFVEGAGTTILSLFLRPASNRARCLADIAANLDPAVQELDMHTRDGAAFAAPAFPPAQRRRATSPLRVSFNFQQIHSFK